jgi:hypothetical protein
MRADKKEEKRSFYFFPNFSGVAKVDYQISFSKGGAKLHNNKHPIVLIIAIVFCLCMTAMPAMATQNVTAPGLMNDGSILDTALSPTLPSGQQPVYFVDNNTQTASHSTGIVDGFMLSSVGTNPYTAVNNPSAGLTGKAIAQSGTRKKVERIVMQRPEGIEPAEGSCFFPAGQANGSTQVGKIILCGKTIEAANGLAGSSAWQIENGIVQAGTRPKGDCIKSGTRKNIENQTKIVAANHFGIDYFNVSSTVSSGHFAGLIVADGHNIKATGGGLKTLMTSNNVAVIGANYIFS